MNFFKNLIIIAVLGAVGYGVYASLARNNAEPATASSVAPAWPGMPKVEIPAGKSSSGPPLALSPTPLKPVTDKGAGGTAPPFASPPVVSTPSAATPGATLLPYPSSSPSRPVPSATNVPAPSTAPAVSLGAPVAPMSPAMENARNMTAPPDVAASNPNTPPAANPAERLLQSRFASFMEEVQKTLQQNKLAEAHQALSTLYSTAELPPEQAKQVTAILDQLAGTVVYSRQSFLEPPYTVQQGDTLDKVAQKYNIPWQLIARVNGLMPSGGGIGDTATKDLPLPVGMELKVVRGPFEAIVHLDRHELTLMVQDRYAGRFAVGVGRDQPKLEGNYMVREKGLNPPYSGSDGVNASPGDPANPLGGAWIGLSDRIGIHGTNDPTAIGRDGNRGAICVSDRDLQDLYGILSVGSRVTVMR